MGMVQSALEDETMGKFEEIDSQEANLARRMTTYCST